MSAAVLLGVLLGALAGQRAVAQTGPAQWLPFTVGGASYAASLEPLRFEQALSSCADLCLGAAQRPATLLPIAALPQTLSGLSSEDPDLAEALLHRLGNITTAQQEHWDAWAWDEYRVCRAVSNVAAQGLESSAFFMTTDRPCSWRLCFVCAEERGVLAAGHSSSSAWYRRHFRTDPLPPSPYALGPAGSGLALVSSDLVMGDPAPPDAMTTAFNDSGRFWSQGPVLSALYRGGNRKLLALRLLREREAERGWELYTNQTAITDAVGPDAALTGEGEQRLRSSSAWYRRHFRTDPLPPSPYALGPAGSGLALVSSDLVMGDPAPPDAMTTAFNDSGRFWSQGPVLSALYRGGNRKLLALRLLREREAERGWELYTNQTAITDAVGPDAALTGEDSTYELYNVGAGYNDYIVAVQGCFRSYQVEMLYFITRTGRQYQLGRGGCTSWFREDAPLGGYLAGVAGRFMATTLWSPADPIMAPGWDELAYINQVRLVWAAPPASGLPTYSVRAQPATAPQLSQASAPAAFCPTARPVAEYVPTCGPISGSTCPSNTCCGVPVIELARDYILCVASPQACQTRCLGGWGWCTIIPEKPLLQFVRSVPGDGSPAATTIYSAAMDAQMSYAAAASYCRASTYMGLTWEMVTAADAFGWTTSLDTRRDAYTTISAAGERVSDLNALSPRNRPLHAGYFWLAADDALVLAAPKSACVRAGFGVPRGRDLSTHTFAISSCELLAAVVCKASAAQNSSRLAAGGVGTGGSVAEWVPGKHVGRAVCGEPVESAGRASACPHTLSLSRRLGGGPYGNGSCSFAVGASVAVVGGLAGGSGPVDAAGNTQQLALNRQLGSLDISMATTFSNHSDSAAVVTALRLGLGDSAGAPDVAAAVGDVSTAGWHTLELSPGEVVTAVSGCAGGFVERLVLHTSLGRLWTTPFLATSLCSFPFLEAAPPGGYLVGLQGSMGSHLEAVRLVWGQPVGRLQRTPPALAALIPSATPAPQLPAASPYPASLPSEAGGYGAGDVGGRGGGGSGGGGRSSGATVGLALGAALGGMALLALLLGGFLAAARWRRVRQQQRGAAAGNIAGSSCCEEGRAAGAGVGCVAGGKSGMPGWQRGEGHGQTVKVVLSDTGESASLGPETTSCNLSSARTLTMTLTTEPQQHCGAAQELGSSNGYTWSGNVPYSDSMDMRNVMDLKCSGLTECMRAEATSRSEDAGQPQARGADVSTQTRKPAAPEPAGSQLCSAISKLQIELSGRQEQLRVTTVLGVGSFGVVYQGTWRGLRVAVKTLVVHDALLGKEGRQRHRAILEASLSLSLSARLRPSPAAERDAAGASTLLPAGTPDVYKLFIIQEFCDVGSLAAALDAGVVGSVCAGGAQAVCALTLALDVACGMAHIHSRNIVHGDLSSSNVLLASNNGVAGLWPGEPHGDCAEEMGARKALEQLWRPPVVAKVADFGLSTRMTDEQAHESNRFQGTPAYAAPEVQAHGRLSKAADVWAFGVLLLELCNGEGVARTRARRAAAAAVPRVPTARPPFSKVVEVLVQVLQEAHQQCQAAAMDSGQGG
ncbi:Tyrosine-protein kinase Fyn [Tetrabaena socialis]|uniref:Tyrosine-protein kinase Fyn n=1 Tax=Tetrabaena socialis TaxID=47790 RepID=A0A2J8AIK6_9CHLO|nr:Tyrosine-protein kinase Fyn [Tetrabaena socialis]|eukprot:PNH12347.1 Tyrosine-protein kinase Fyn [Tetrabaena socialis]